MPDYNFNDYDNFSKIRDKYNEEAKVMLDKIKRCNHEYF